MGILQTRNSRWGILLAGGDGVRLKPLTRFLSGDERPKQFCHLYKGTTLLDHARHRAERSVPASQIFYSLNRDHEHFYACALRDCPAQRLIQPANRGTAPAILSSLLLIARQDENATVAIFPSDHHYSDEDVATEAVENAFELAQRVPERVVLIGARPDAPEVEYGWIEVGGPMDVTPDSFHVRAFHEKPSAPAARFLLEQGALWNTFVLVGKVMAFLEMTCSATPGLVHAFKNFSPEHAPNGELRIPDGFYAGVPTTDFSREVLSTETQRLAVQRLGHVLWSDLGDCDRAVAALTRSGIEPRWATTWRATHALAQSA